MKRNWKPVIKSFFEIALKHGFTPHSVDNGDDFVPTDTVEKAVDEVDATDESYVRFNHPKGQTIWFFIVLGNEPWETICDYRVDALAEIVADEFAKKWEGKKCPFVNN